MPVEIQYTSDNIGVIVSAVGRVTGKEIIDSQRSIYQGKSFSGRHDWIVDWSRCTQSDLQFGVSRMYESLVSDSHFRTRVFRNRDAAEAWIKKSWLIR